MIIKWKSGWMEIDPAAFLQQPDITRRFRRLIRLSRESDLLYQTNAVPAWALALQEERQRIQEMVKYETDLYQQGNDAVRKAHESPLAPFSEQMRLKEAMEKTLAERKIVYEKKMRALNKRFLRMKKLEQEATP